MDHNDLSKLAEIEATKVVAKQALEYLVSVCKPAAGWVTGKLGTMVDQWRLRNVAKMAAHIPELLPAGSSMEDVAAHPAVLREVIEGASWCDDDEVQKMWAGLLISSNEKDNNKPFTRILSHLTALQAQILLFAVRQAEVYTVPPGCIFAKPQVFTLDDISKATGETNLDVLDVAIDGLRDLGLLFPMSGIITEPGEGVRISLSSVALHLCARSLGWRRSAAEYFGVQVPQTSPKTSPEPG